MRCARMTACISTAGFHQGSSTKTWFAACKFKPSPPDLRLIKMTLTLGSSRNACKFAARCATGMEPRSLLMVNFAFFKRHSTISIMAVYCENTIALLRCPFSWFLMSVTRVTKCLHLGARRVLGEIKLVQD